MRGKRSFGRGGHHGGPFKKIKRSKKFWQQRQTATFTAPPVEDEEEKESSSEDENDQDTNTYETLLETFSRVKKDEEGAQSESESDENDDESVSSDSGGDPDVAVEKVEDSEDSENSESGDPEEQTEDKDSEEDLEDDDDVDDDDNDDDDRVLDDTFTARIISEIPEEIQKKIQSKDLIRQGVTWPTLGKLIVQSPQWKMKRAKEERQILDKSEDNDDKIQVLKEMQAKLVNISMEEPLQDFGLDQSLKSNLAVANVKNLKDLSQPLTHFQSELLSVLTTYKDLYYSEQSFDNLEQIRLVYVVHALNHVLKTRKQILKNSHRLSKNAASAGNVRDQGLCRPKVLIVVPFKESARRVVDMMGKLLFGQVKAGNVANKKRFDGDFGSDFADLEKVKQRGSKPDDFYEMFAGDTDDSFKLGLAVTKKTLKLYTEFYSSDVILSSPLGLRMVIGVDGELKRDYDFLSSIEMIIFDQMEILCMQNWDHISHIFDHLHLQPSQAHGVDFSRVRMWTLNGLQPFYRQTLLFSNGQLPEVNALLNKKCSNFCGSVRVANPHPGQLSSICTKVPIVFHRFDSSGPGSSIDERFDYFANRIMPDFEKDLMYHTLIFVPSYFDYVRVRNWCNGRDLDIGEICEYTKEKKVAMARDLFFHSEKHFLLYTERAHFYKRYALKGIRHLILYQLPLFPRFFAELCNFMQMQNKKGGSDGNMSVTALYCKYDVHRLAPIVGHSRAQDMLGAAKSLHMFSPGQH